MHTPAPSKKRKTTNARGANARAAQYVQHWDDPGSQATQMSYDDQPTPSGSGTAVQETIVEEEEDAIDEEESRELTHEEIWDDSALIDAWNSAMAEYKTYHGPEKDWKKEPVKKSPLWYNVPPSPNSKQKAKQKAAAPSTFAPAVNGSHTQADGEVGEDSTPLDFNTFVPSHDPSLAASFLPHPSAAPGPEYSQSYLPSPSGPMVSQDEAFQRALSAMYWGGYWTAVYHCHRGMGAGNSDDQNEEADPEDERQEDEQGEGVEDEDEDMVPTQR
ncbi:hypothetical protein OBBRIDRAFT_798867 [Obba rivulosa]|uniref:Survival Motor Neuron Gemin2-binding domain-containing protein n=1 Tax=Obba rivulosa TaxID=1052685 RepID=A0A8E2DJF2_9APHY|nr:hypothetical protein OBBRIDRAFT_798867 [Obba rivulosa]